nr:MAG TPA: Cyclin-dependent kinase 9 [Caudoviricetes sp.]
MGRLIDAGLVLDNLSGRLESMKDYDAVKDVINNMPTAYDPDKVVEQLEERTASLKDCTKHGNKTADQQSKSYDTMMMYEVMDLVDDLLEIVKAGVSDGN